MKLIDANYALRYILNDNPAMAQTAAECIANSQVCITHEVVAEVVYVLHGVYHVPKDKIRDALFALLDELEISQLQIMRQGLEHYVNTGLDFVDCILLAYHTVAGAEICTFDKKLNKFLSASL